MINAIYFSFYLFLFFLSALVTIKKSYKQLKKIIFKCLYHLLWLQQMSSLKLPAVEMSVLRMHPLMLSLTFVEPVIPLSYFVMILDLYYHLENQVREIFVHHPVRLKRRDLVCWYLHLHWWQFYSWLLIDSSNMKQVQEINYSLI